MTGMASHNFEQHAAALVDWWRLAALKPACWKNRPTGSPTRAKPVAAAQDQANLIAMPARTKSAFPETLSAFHLWLEQSPESRKPTGSAHASCPQDRSPPPDGRAFDMPDADDALPSPLSFRRCWPAARSHARAIGHRSGRCLSMCARGQASRPAASAPESRTALAARIGTISAWSHPNPCCCSRRDESCPAATDTPRQADLHIINHTGGKLPGVARSIRA